MTITKAACPARSEDGRACCYGEGHAVKHHLWEKSAGELGAASDRFLDSGLSTTERRLREDRLAAVTIIAMALPSVAMDGTAAHAARCAVDEITRLREAAS